MKNNQLEGKVIGIALKMNKVKEKPVSYSTYQGKHKKFYRQIYFEYICLLITDLYKETVPDNEFCNDFIERLNTLEDDPEPYYAIGFIEHYEPYRWAWYIIVNKYEVRNLTEEEMLLEGKLFDTFLKSKNIKFWNIEDDKN
ncbi:hypothetical protein HMPREF1551_01838 [Capnocytophaga sp. oral taxon 863 str. F0517]|uniref:hypothetical protein n=1 Tax=Capnocytophaga sp. oral taxon 863 TaxID=1227265 RepID=UPI000396791D|nr:hypothetical protein [Capnocytophaga sp. oral taxon 863]ERI62545.1 hypothetical protein HMPREF1551_01838 [Capnocytophaga sp. oral taxon 863 str. F0517]